MSIAVPADLAAAIEARERTPLVRVAVDWDGDGFGPAGSLDDLSGKQGTVTIDRTLTTDLPDQVRLSEGASAATGTVELAEADRTDGSTNPAGYYTRGSTSPLGGKERVNRATTVDIGFVTASGPQYVRRLTGFTRNMATKSQGRSASLTMLDNRAQLRETVTLVPTNGVRAGADGTWLITQALFASRVAAGPIPRTAGSMLWMPMYGSITALGDPDLTQWATFSNFDGDIVDPAFRAGPFVLAADLFYNADDDARVLAVGVAAADPTWLALTGRLEYWTLGVSPGLPVESGAHLRTGITYSDRFVSSNRVYIGMGVDAHMHLWVLDASATTVIHHVEGALVVPADGAWHAVGAHWDHNAGTVTFRVDNSFETVATGVLPSDVPITQSVLFQAVGINPMSDLHVHNIAASAPWLADTLNITAVIDPSTLKLNAVFDPTPYEQWDLITQVAAAEQATAAFDEVGVFRYRTRRRLVDTAGQTVQRVLTTADGSLLDAQIDDGIDQIRNIVQITYTPADVDPGGAIQTSDVRLVYTDKTQRTVPAESTVDIPIVFSAPVISLDLSLFQQDITVGPSQFDPYFITTINADFSDDGLASGFYTALTATVTSWTPAGAIVQIVNPNAIPMYLTGMGLKGLDVTVGAATVVEVRDDTSVATYGPQLMQLTMPGWVQTAAMATSLAATLVGDLKDPHPTVSGLSIVGDPRRQLGDRVALADPGGTQLVGEFWLTQISDQVDGNGGYTQTIAARGASTVMRWGVGRWGIEVWGSGQ